MQKTIVFTICSINYLSQAKILGESLLKHNPDYDFYIGLVDDIEKTGIDKQILPKYKFVEVAELNIEGFADMYDKYNITELNTAVKPFFFKYFYEKFQDTKAVIYLDPDIEVFQPFNELNEALVEHKIVLTPHIIKPYSDGLLPRERDILNVGVFNLGFLGTSRGEETQEFIDWWCKKLQFECFVDLPNGMFVDQLWVNFAPIYWNSVHIFKNIGYNMAYWNLHERHLSVHNNVYKVNTDQNLVFYHYSGYHPLEPNFVSRYQSRNQFDEQPALRQLFGQYGKQLLDNGQENFKKFRNVYLKPEPQWIPPRRGQRPRKFLKRVLNKLINVVEEI